MAKSFSEGFVQAANFHGLNGYVFSYPGCSFQLSDSPFTATNECASWRGDVLSAMQQLQPKVVIIANLHSLYVDPPPPDWSIEDTQSIWGSELKRTVEALSVLRTQVVIAQPPPKFEFDLRYDISLLNTNSVREDREVVVSRRKTMNELEQIAVSEFQHVQPIVDFTDRFCDDKVCDPRVDNILMFEDTDHLSVDGSKYVSPEIERAISGALTS
jgi:hypothetical protein